MKAKYAEQAREVYGDDSDISVALGDAVAPTWDEGHEALLERPDLLEMLVAWADTQVKDITDVWRAVFLGIASIKAPAILQGEVPHNPQCDVLLIGELSTCKSGVLKLTSRIAPSGMVKTNFTPAAFTGTIDPEGDLKPGIAKRANGGVLCVDELDKLLRRYPILDGLMRTAQSEHHVDHETARGIVDYDTAYLTVAGANPEGDLFNDAAIRAQIPFDEGLLSRYAYIKPLAYSISKVNSIAAYMASTWFSEAVTEGTLDVGTIRSMFAALYDRLVTVNRVTVKREHLIELYDHYEAVQSDVAGKPLLTTRDFEAAMKYLNASAALHVAQRKVDGGTLHAERGDLENALFMLDATVETRRLMLADERAAVAATPIDRAAKILRNALLSSGDMSRSDAVELLVNGLGISPATAYRRIIELAQRNTIEVDGLSDSTIGLAQS